jgi:hypothetical protein
MNVEKVSGKPAPMLATAHTEPRQFRQCKGSHLRILGGVLDPSVYHSGRMGTKKGTFRPERKHINKTLANQT